MPATFPGCNASRKSGWHHLARDATGHGDLAALSSLKLYGATNVGLINQLAASGLGSASDVLARIDQTFRFDHDDAGAVLAHVVLDPQSGILQYANAGNSPPVYVVRDSEVIELKASGLSLGSPSGPAYSEFNQGTTVFQLKEGDLVFMMTDGVTEAPVGNKVLFKAQIKEALLKSIRTSSSVDAIVSDFVSRIPSQNDDRALIAFRFKR